MSVSAASFLPSDAEVRVCGTFPLELHWEGPSDASAASSWIVRRQREIEAALSISGALLLRGWPLRGASDFGALVSSFAGWSDLPYEDSLSYAVRLPVCDRVCTTNEGKTGGMVFHHEQAQAPRFPSRLFFYCETPATSGGGTGVCPSDVVWSRLAAAYPAFAAACETHGLIYSATLPPEQDTSVGVGRSWKSFFGVDNSVAAEARMAALGYTWEWRAGESLYMRTPVLAAVRKTVDANGATRKVFFNQAIAQYLANARDFSRGKGSADIVSGEDLLAQYLCFGDGSRVPTEPLEFANAVCNETAVELDWRAGNVALLDNFLVMHARRAYEGPRRVLASLVA